MRVLIVDDEPLARSRLKRMLEELDGVELAGEAATGAAALSAVQAQTPDVVLLDIRMPDMDGLAAAAAMMQLEQPPAIIFCTAYDSYAVAAFDAQAVDYLVKPVERSRLAAALRGAQRLNRAQLAAIGRRERGEMPGRSHLTARNRRGLERIPIDAVYCLLADHKYVTAIHRQGELLLDESLTALEKEFGDRFLRVHRGALVARAYLRGLERLPDGSHRARVDGIAQGPSVSRRHLAALRMALDTAEDTVR